MKIKDKISDICKGFMAFGAILLIICLVLAVTLGPWAAAVWIAKIIWGH
jgi:hypothetical protein